MIQKHFVVMDKREHRMNFLASRSNERRADWMNLTLGALETDLKDGRKENFEQAQNMAKAFYFGGGSKLSSGPSEVHQ